MPRTGARVRSPALLSRAAATSPLRREGAGIGDAAVDPLRQGRRAPNLLGVDPEPASHLAAAHLHRVCPALGDELVRLSRVDADEQPALAAGGDGHVAADEEGEPAEHLLLDRPGVATDQITNAGRELFVVRHRSIVRGEPHPGRGSPWVQEFVTTLVTRGVESTTPPRDNSGNGVPASLARAGAARAAPRRGAGGSSVRRLP